MGALEGDKNYQRYLAEKEDRELSDLLKGRWVGYVDGERVADDVSRDILELLLNSGYPKRPKFVIEFGSSEEVIDIPTPFIEE